MKTKFLTILLTAGALLLAVSPFLSLPGKLEWWMAGEGVFMLLIIVFLYRAIVKPVVVANRGLDLLRAQDFNNRLVKTGEPNADRIVKLFNDLMTKLKNERLRMKEQDTFLRLLIDASPMGIVMLNLDNEIAITNPAFSRIAELPHDDNRLHGKKIEDFSSPVIKALASIPGGESRVIRLDGSRMFRGYHLWFMQDGFRRRFFMIESLTDEVRRAEKEAYEKVIRMISHEVNNTMGSVQSVLEFLAEEMEEDPDMSATIESCRERSAQMCGFIDAFANLARIPEPELKTVDLDEEIAKMLPFLQLMASENVDISFASPSVAASERDRKIIQADIPMLQQAIVNIVKNAVESFPDNENGLIRIETNKDSRGISLQISNNGKAIGTETAAHLFTPFFSTKRSGRGLGLTLVSDVLRKHGCAFSLRTEDDSITRFRILFRN